MPSSSLALGVAFVSLACLAQLPAQNSFFTGAAPINELNQPGSSNFSPTLTEDELYMVFASTRAGGAGGYDLYETTRATVDSLWNPPVRLAVLNSSGDDYKPCISYDGLELYFISTRAGGLGLSDIYRTTRPNPMAPWQPPQNIGPPINGPGVANDDPALTQNGLTMFYTGPGAGGSDIWMTQRPAIGAPFGPPQPFPPANSTGLDHSPIPDGNGDTLWFSSNRAGGPLGSADFYMVWRDPVTNTFSPPVPIPDVSSPDWDSNGWHGGRTNRFYVSRIVGTNAFLWVMCPRLRVIWIERCLLSACIPHFQLFPPRVWWERVWLVSIQVPVVVIEWYRWFNWPSGGFSFLLASFNTQPGIPASNFLPGGQGTVILNPAAHIVLRVALQQPNQQAGMETYQLAVPPSPAFIGLRIHMQEASLEFGNNLLTISEAGRVQLAN